MKHAFLVIVAVVFMSGCGDGAGSSPSAGAATAPTVNAALVTLAPPSDLVYQISSATYTVGNAIQVNLPSVSGGAVATYSIAPSLPAGLSLDPVSGIVSGTPTMASFQTNYTVTAGNSVGSVSAVVSITTVSPPGAVAVGIEVSCAVSGAGNVYCWGFNIGGSGGELGNGTTNSSLTPVEVVGVGGSGYLSGIIAVAAGEAYDTCAVSSAGNAYCWGSNDSGQLGNNSTIGSLTPVEVVGVGGSGYLSNITAITVQNESTCALSSAGNVFCWGLNTSGRLGNNSTINSLTPVEVVGVAGSGFLSSIIAITAGDGDYCALSSAGNVYCWGNNGMMQLGNNTALNSLTPVEMVSADGSGYLSDITAIAGGGVNTCAVSRAGNVFCWGNNYMGGLGDNSTSSSPTPVEVVGVGGSGYLSGITTIAVGNVSVCAASNIGNVYCWGNNEFGILGSGTSSVTNYLAPVEVVGVNSSGYLSGITAIAIGEVNSCARSSAGNIFCWGYNFGGELGNNSTAQSNSPVEVVSEAGSGWLQLTP